MSERKKSALGMTCNIDRRGRRARAIVGISLLIAAAAAFWFASTTQEAARTVSFILAISFAVGGLFCLFEAANAWCAVRAMGIKTRL